MSGAKKVETGLSAEERSKKNGGCLTAAARMSASTRITHVYTCAQMRAYLTMSIYRATVSSHSKCLPTSPD